MIGIYPVILRRGGEYISVTIPDMGIATRGRDIAEALYMARGAIATEAFRLEACGAPLPMPSDIFSIDRDPSDILMLVDVDFIEYRLRAEARSVKKNCTIPAWLEYKAEQAGVNFSAALQAGIKSALGISD